jgi:SAM-dependent methyltransferase
MTSSSYDETPYASSAIPEAELGRLGALARLHGVETRLPTDCSVLEIGCGTGMNSLVLAERYPQSRFVAFDLSLRQINTAKEFADRCKLSNLSLVCSSIEEFTCERGSFDFIICHGVYSWIASEARQKLLALCAHALSDAGVAFISYNVNPGWRQRGILRDVMRSGALAIAADGSADEQVKAGLELVSLVATEREKKGDPYGHYLREGLLRSQEMPSSYLFHEYLEEYNQPVLFSDFMREASGVGLQFLSEARPAMMYGEYLGPEVARYLQSIGDNVVAREQCLDVITNRMFRETLLCREGRLGQVDPKASVFRNLIFTTDYRRLDGVSVAGVEKAQFREIVSQRTVQAPRDEHADVLGVIGRGEYGQSDFALLLGQLHANGITLDERAVMAAVITLWRAGFIHVVLPHSLPKAEKYRAYASCLARAQIERGEAATSLLHRSHRLSPVERACLRLADGSQTFDNIARQVAKDTHEQAAYGAIARLRELGFFYSERLS